jgi:nucleotide-binding universal stress UspA family protein
VVAARHWPHGADVRAVTVVDALESSAHADRCVGPADLAWCDEASARRAVEAAAECLRAAGLTAAPLILAGEPAPALVREARRWRADCIFLGANGHGRLERLLLGSVSASVAARAPCTVEVFRRRGRPQA